MKRSSGRGEKRIVCEVFALATVYRALPAIFLADCEVLVVFHNTSSLVSLESLFCVKLHGDEKLLLYVCLNREINDAPNTPLLPRAQPFPVGCSGHRFSPALILDLLLSRRILSGVTPWARR